MKYNILKHILFLTHYFPPEVNAPANRTYEHAVRWVRDGVNVTVVTNHPNHPSGKLFPGYKNRWITRENMHGIRVIRVKTYLTPNAGKIRRSLNYFVYMCLAIIASSKVKSYDVIVATSPQFFCGIAGAIARRINKKPFVLEIRDLWPDSITAVNAVRKRGLVKRLVEAEKWMYFSADKIITLTNSFKEHIVGFGFPEQRIITITNGVDFKRLVVGKKLTDIFDKQERFIISYIGTFGLAHKLDVVLQAAELLKNSPTIHFLLVGDGADRHHLEEFVSTHQIENVTILPLQPKINIPYFLDISDVGLIMLKNNELFKTVLPSKMFEYMGMKKPLLLSAPPGEASGIVKKHECGIHIDADQPRILVEKCLFFFENRNIANRMGENGYKAASRYYDREVLAKKILDFLITVAD